jgi:MbtH protein
MRDEADTEMLYKVVRNAEGQFSIWPAHKKNALGWEDVNYEGRKEVCLTFVAHTWKDMRPLSLIRAMGTAH